MSNVFYRPEELWIRGKERSLLEARLFPALDPKDGALSLERSAGCLLAGDKDSLHRWRQAWRLSLKEVMSLAHQEAELHWRDDLLFKVGRVRVVDALQGRQDVCLLPCFRAAVLGSQQRLLLETLDNSK